MKIKEKTKEAFLDVLVRLIQVVVAVLIISPFVAGILRSELLTIGILSFFFLIGVLILISQSMEEG